MDTPERKKALEAVRAIQAPEEAKEAGQARYPAECGPSLRAKFAQHYYQF